MSHTTPRATPLPPLTLVLGGARSGKSRHAEALVLGSGLDPVYLATAEPLDGEMSERIALHRDRRGPAWRTLEVPIRLAAALRQEATADRAILVDCLTLWLSNLLGAGHDIEAETRELCAALRHLAGPVVLVSNEVGQGVVPPNALARRFVDDAGRLHQAIVAQADQVVFMVAGLPSVLKAPGDPVESACTS